jgi:molybdopterin-guanine dinucleotide biosynthesis protein A
MHSPKRYNEGVITIAIQAGGQSRRMGREKALVLLAGTPLIEHLLKKADGLVDEIIVTTNRPRAFAYLGLPLFQDPAPGVGALQGLHTALSAAQGNKVLVLACDMPFVQRDLLEHLLQLAGEADIVIPRYQGMYEPLHAVYDRAACLPPIEEALAGGERRVTGFFPKVSVLTVEAEDLSRLDPDNLSFFNVNSMADLERAERLIEDLI